jgi:hypothetical protein
MIKIHEIPKSTITDIGDKYCVDERNEVYFLAYESNIEKRMSVLWSDLKFVRKFFGVKRFDETSNVTKKSLNESRAANIEDMKLAIKLNVNLNDLKRLQPDGSFGMYENPNFNKLMPKGVAVDLRKEIPYEPKHLLGTEKKRYEEDIARGLYVLCMYV